MLDPIVFRIADTIHRERLEIAMQQAPRRSYLPTPPLRDRLRLALSQRLIAWGQRLQQASTPISSRT
jgi:hypothetical protein